MKILFTLIVLIGISASFAQNVGIGTASPDPSAKLQISDPNRGLLIPNVSLGNVAAVAPVSTPATGLLVWNTNASTVGGTGIGYYYWSGSSWIRLTTSIETLSFADNGLTVNGVNTVQLGGGLIKNTNIFQGNFNLGIVLDGTGDFIIASALSPYAYFQVVDSGNVSMGAADFFSDASLNRIGMGTIIPGAKLDITNTTASDASMSINQNDTTNSNIALTINNYGTGTSIKAIANKSVLAGVMTVGKFDYTGADVDDHIGVAGSCVSVVGWGIGVKGNGNFYGVHGEGGTYGIFATGNIGATGTKTFLIDHPTDPENKELRHFSIESNEVLNLYRGIVILDASGEAAVELPSYFNAINKDFSYQLTAIGTPQQPYVLKEITGNTFSVAGAPNTKVSWVVYANRNDRYLQQNPQEGIDVRDKPEGRKGKYYNPELFSLPKEKGIGYGEEKTELK